MNVDLKNSDFDRESSDSLARAESEFQQMLGDMPLIDGCLTGKTFLDIGCGCDSGLGDKKFLPIMPIFAAEELGATSFGLDKEQYTGPGSEKYYHIKADITQVEDLLKLTGVPLDLIHCNLLTGSAYGDIPSPNLGLLFKLPAMRETLNSKILDLAEKALTENGVILLNGELLRKEKGTLKRVV